MSVRPQCADCSGRVSHLTAKVWVSRDGESAKVVCKNCQHHYPREHQYSPTKLPRATRPIIRGGNGQ